MNRILVIMMLACCFAATAASAREVKIVGWVEEVLLTDVGIRVRAKLDTGAKTSSIDSEIIDIRKSGKQTKTSTGDTVVFSVDAVDGAPKTFEREVIRYVRIKLKGGGFVRRPVIKMNFCIAGREVEEEVNLANRENFIYPVLVGRNMMAHADLAINAGVTMTARPICKLGD